jgi:hypothetical protein
MLSPNDTCHKNEINEADQQKRSATNASLTHHSDNETGTSMHYTNVGAVTRESVSAIADIPTTLEAAMQRQEETAVHRKEQLGNKRKKRKDSAPDDRTNLSTAMPIRSEANTGMFNENICHLHSAERTNIIYSRFFFCGATVNTNAAVREAAAAVPASTNLCLG